MLWGKYCTHRCNRFVRQTVPPYCSTRREGFFSRGDLRQFRVQPELTDERLVAGLLLTLIDDEMARLRVDSRFEVG